MLLPKFDFYEPLNMEEACQVMSGLGSRAKLLAGGTDLIVNMKRGTLSPGHVVSLSRINDLKGVTFTKGRIRIGACVTAAELCESEEIKTLFRALQQGASDLGSPLIRNLATIAGNLVSARPAADLPPPLMAYDAKVVLMKESGEREIPLEDFFTGPGETMIEPDEIVKEILVEKPRDCSGAGYIKLGVRKALEISLVNVAAFVSLDDPDGAIQSARVVLGAVAPTPMRAHSAEKVLLGEKPGEALFVRAGEAAAEDSKPIDDFRAGAEYRRAMVQVLTRRTLDLALNEARSR
ncbi:MAG: xanthine dehydrogenase family protein subunit M [Desulfobacteraceae bacterium]|nr:xanthine dehydrogenase family protein subunit M [Desulfobacteraceae bacterium]